MVASDLAASLATAGFAASADLARLALPAFRITATPTDDTQIPVGASKLGGMPDLPAGFSWPTVAGVPMSFIAQAHLAEVSFSASPTVLPPDGTLAFFYDARQQVFGDQPTDRGGWQVAWFEQSATLSRASAPAQLPADVRFHAATARFTKITTLPQQPQIDAPQLAWSADEQAKYDQFWANYPSTDAHAAPLHQLLGHPNTLQDDMRLQCQLLSHGVTDANDPRAAALNAGALDWRLLLQIDSDDALGMRWGDGGMLYYWAPLSALQARQFEQSWMIIQTN